MISERTKKIAETYTRRHAGRQDVFGTKPYANYGYWTREGLSVEEACDALTDLVARTARIGPGDRVLEVGCGYGASAVVYTQRYQPASVIGIDVTEIRIQTGIEFVAQNDLAATIQLRLGNATALDFEPAQFTKVLAVECAFHFDTRRDFFREAARVLVPGGRLALTDIIPRRGADLAQVLACEASISAENPLDLAINAYDADVYAGHLKEAGFDDLRIEVITDQVLPHFAAYMQRLGKEMGGEKGPNRIAYGRHLQALVDAGAEYVLVGARKAEAPANQPA